MRSRGTCSDARTVGATCRTTSGACAISCRRSETYRLAIQFAHDFKGDRARFLHVERKRDGADDRVTSAAAPLADHVDVVRARDAGPRVVTDADLAMGF